MNPYGENFAAWRGDPELAGNANPTGFPHRRFTVKRAGSDDSLRCSFCHKSQDVVGKLISSPSDYPRAYICDECIAVCNSILEDDRQEQPYGLPSKLPKPLELKEYLD